ncbi:MAG: hypothetical protein V4805_11530 [Pseudomonadota bacterium]
MLRRVMIILWSSFLVAIIAEGCFFSLFDPHEVFIAERQIELSGLAAYTLGFFMFWGCCALSSSLTYYLLRTPSNQVPD